MRAGWSESILQRELTGFVDGLNVSYERKRGEQDDVRILRSIFAEIWNILRGIGLRWEIMSLFLGMLCFR